MNKFCNYCQSETERRANGVCRPCAKRRANKWSSANKDKIRERKAKYYIENIEKVRESHAKYYAANTEKVRDSVKRYQIANPEKKRELFARWREKHPGRMRAHRAKWQAENPDKRCIIEQNRRARKRETGGALSQGLAEHLHKLQRGKCACGCKQPLGTDYHLDHRMPLVLGGSNTDDNIQLLRKLCNLQKSGKHPIDYMQQRGFLL